MRYKRSFFNPTLFRQNLSRFWPLPVGVFLFYFLTVTMHYWDLPDGLPPYNKDIYYMSTMGTIYSDCQFASFVMVFFALLAAALMFRHIHTRKDTQFYLGLPMTRTCLYVTNLVSGYGMLAVPVILNVIIVGITTMTWGIGFLSLPLAGCILSALTIFYGLAVLACVLGGQTFGGVLIYTGLNLALYILSAASGEIIEWLLPGWSGGSPFYDVVQKLTPAAQYLEMYGWEPVEGAGYQFREGWVLPVYALVGGGLLVLSGWLYNIRRSESAGDMVSFRWVKPICKVLVALIAGTAVTLLIFSNITTEQDLSLPMILVPLVIFTAVGYFAAEMVIKKSFRVINRGTCLGCGVLMAAVIVLGCCLNAGGFGYETRMPERETVVEAQVKGIEMTPEDTLALHSYVLDHQEGLTNGTGNFAWDSISIQYTLEDGSLFTRYYYVRLNSDIDAYLEDLLNKEDYVLESWLGDLGGELPNSGYIYFYQDYDEETGEEIRYFQKGDQEIYANYSITAEEAERLYEAVCLDIAEGNLPARSYADRREGRSPVGELSFEIIRKTDVEGSNAPMAEILETAFVTLDPTMTHTIGVLGEMGYELIR